MRKYSEKGWARRNEQRKGWGDFFTKHAKISANKCCAECGAKLNGHVSEVAHILPKSLFPSIATNDENIIYLCGMYTENQCHTNFDNRDNEYVGEMNIFPLVVKQFTLLTPYIKENIPYKTIDRYTHGDT